MFNVAQICNCVFDLFFKHTHDLFSYSVIKTWEKIFKKDL